MSALTPDERAELDALRTRVAELERERAEEVARAAAAVAAAQERAYWLDRWHVDLNALMEKPGASEFRAGLRLVRAVLRAVKQVKKRILG